MRTEREDFEEPRDYDWFSAIELYMPNVWEFDTVETVLYELVQEVLKKERERTKPPIFGMREIRTV